MPIHKLYIILSTAANVIMFGLLIAAPLQIRQAKVEKTDKTDSVNKTDITSQKVEKKLEQADIIVTKEGFSPRGFQIFADNKTVLSIKNADDKPHSFVIDELGIDETIEPGNTIETVIDREFNGPTSLTFRSKTENDSPDIFSGLIMILKQQETADISNNNNK